MLSSFGRLNKKREYLTWVHYDEQCLFLEAEEDLEKDVRLDDARGRLLEERVVEVVECEEGLGSVSAIEVPIFQEVGNAGIGRGS